MERLPQEILIIILSHTAPPDILAMACVNRFFHTVALDPVLHRSASFQGEWHVSVKFVTRYITRFKKSLLFLDLQNCYWLKPAPLVKAICRCQDLVHLQLIGCPISIESLSEILSRNENLKSLSWGLPINFCERVFNQNLLAKTDKVLNEIYQKFPTCKLSSFELKFPDREMSCQQFKELFQIIRYILSDKKINELKVWYGSCRQIVGNGDQLLHVKLKESYIDINLTESICSHFKTKLNFLCFIIESALTSASHEGDLEILVAPFFTSKKCMLSSASVTMGYLKKANLNSLGNNTFSILAFLTSGSHLRHLNLSYCEAITSNFLVQIASECPNLSSLCLAGCHRSLDSLEGLQALGSHCPALKVLVLTEVHYHNRNCQSGTNELLLALSSMPQITSLTLPICCVSSTAKSKVSNNKDVGQKTKENEPSQSPHDNDTQQNKGNLDEFATSCKIMRQFELIAADFRTVGFFNKRRDCPLPECDLLVHFAKWKYLEDLTLAGLPLVVSMAPLVNITKACTELKYLSLAHVGSLQHSSGFAALCKALSHCTKLQFLRVEQPYLNITPALISSLSISKNLQRVCFIARNGSLDTTRLFDWFEKCRKLTVLQIFVGNLSINAGKIITANLKSRYGAKRPALCVLVQPYKDNDNLLEQARANIPAVHFKELTLFSSKVANDLQ